MNEIKTPNWRLSAVSPTSTGHRYQITDRRTENVTYFDSVKVYNGAALTEIKLYREDEDMGKNGARAGVIRNLDGIPTIILDALKTLEDGDTIASMGDRL